MPDFRALGHLTPPATSLVLDREESHHLVVVNRAQVGHEVVVFDGHGREWLCRLRHASKQAAELEVLQTLERAPLPYRIALAQALPKGPAFDGIVRKATELGVDALLPLQTSRTQVHLSEDREDRKRDKWRTAALEAAKQCGNPWVPEIAAPVAFGDFLKNAGAYDLKLVASLQPETQPVDEAFDRWCAEAGRLPQRALWLVGPEGDLTQDEVKRAMEAGFVPVTLGPLVLRCETAATCAVALLAQAWQRALRRRSA